MSNESESAADDLLGEVRAKLTKLYECDRTRADAISKEVRAVEETYGTILSDHAEFWLLLGVGRKLAEPLPINGNVASAYFSKAHSCAVRQAAISEDDYDAMQKHYMEMLYTQLYLRANRPSSQMSTTEASKYHRAADNAKRAYDRTFSTPLHTS